MVIVLNDAQKQYLFDAWFSYDEDLESFQIEEFGDHWNDRKWLAEQKVQIVTEPMKELEYHLINWPAIFVNGLECTQVNNENLYDKAWRKLMSLGDK